MQTVKIKNKKYIFKNIIISIFMLILCGLFIWVFNHLKFRYQYYTIEPDGSIYNIGISSNDKLIEDTLDECLKKVSEKTGIVDFYFSKYFGKKIVLFWDNNKNVDIEIKKLITQDINIIIDINTSRSREVVISLASYSML